MIQKLNGSAVVNVTASTQLVMELRDEDKFHKLVRHDFLELEEPELGPITSVPVTKEKRKSLDASVEVGSKASPRQAAHRDSRRESLAAGRQTGMTLTQQTSQAGGVAQTLVPPDPTGRAEARDSMMVEPAVLAEPEVHLHQLNKTITQQSAVSLRGSSYFEHDREGKKPEASEHGFNSKVFGTNAHLRDILKPKHGVLVRSNRDEFGASRYRPLNPNSISLSEYRELYEPKNQSLAQIALRGSRQQLAHLDTSPPDSKNAGYTSRLFEKNEPFIDSESKDGARFWTKNKDKPTIVSKFDRIRDAHKPGYTSLSRTLLSNQKEVQKSVDATKLNRIYSKAALDGPSRDQGPFRKYLSYKKEDQVSYGGAVAQSLDGSSFHPDQSLQALSIQAPGAQSPVHQYIHFDKKLRFTLKAKDRITLSPSLASLARPLHSRNSGNQAYGSGVVDKARLAQYRMERRELHLRKNLLPRDLVPDDGDEGRGIFKRKPKITQGILDIIGASQRAAEDALSMGRDAGGPRKGAREATEGSMASGANLLSQGSQLNVQQEDGTVRIAAEAEELEGA